MGRNKGYSIYEQTIIAVYDSGLLTKDLLLKLLEPYYNTDMDHGGCNDLSSQDGLTAD